MPPPFEPKAYAKPLGTDPPWRYGWRLHSPESLDKAIHNQRVRPATRKEALLERDYRRRDAGDANFSSPEDLDPSHEGHITPAILADWREDLASEPDARLTEILDEAYNIRYKSAAIDEQDRRHLGATPPPTVDGTPIGDFTTEALLDIAFDLGYSERIRDAAQAVLNNRSTPAPAAPTKPKFELMPPTGIPTVH